MSRVFPTKGNRHQTFARNYQLVTKIKLHMEQIIRTLHSLQPRIMLQINQPPTLGGKQLLYCPASCLLPPPTRSQAKHTQGYSP